MTQKLVPNSGPKLDHVAEMKAATQGQVIPWVHLPDRAEAMAVIGGTVLRAQRVPGRWQWSATFTRVRRSRRVGTASAAADALNAANAEYSRSRERVA